MRILLVTLLLAGCGGSYADNPPMDDHGSCDPVCVVSMCNEWCAEQDVDQPTCRKKCQEQQFDYCSVCVVLR